MFIKRNIEKELLSLSRQYPVITVTGPRQSGKTTIVTKAFKDKKLFSFEDPDVRRLALEDPRKFLGEVPDGAIFDEIQNAPEILSYIQAIVDKKKKNGMFILTGSQQLNLMNSITQSLAGRTAIVKLLPLSISELSNSNIRQNTEEYLYRGFYPRIYAENLDPTKAYKNYFETYVQRDLRQLINVKNLALFEKFIRLCAGRIGSIFNASNLSNEVGVSVPTIESWLSILQASFVVLLLQPYYANINKRLMKSPKLYFYDVGLASYLLGIENTGQLNRDPLYGGLFENMIILEAIKHRFNKGLDHNLFFYRDSNRNEVDLLFKKGSKIVPIEIKSAQTYTSSFNKGIDYLYRSFPDRVTGGYIVYCGKQEQEINQYKLVNYLNNEWLPG